ncbi:MAG: class II fructose-bisphosphate aldolase [Parcubacteria group bacterium]|nr:class II fructose-bisphosphate aldolase [Parcubacteria group bacterium]
MLNAFKQAQENKYAIGAFNVSNLEQLKAIIQAIQKLKSPVIIATSQGESKFIGKKQIRALVDVYKKETGLPIFLHLDHGKSLEVIQEAIDAGYDSIQFDGSELSFEENIEMTKKVVDLAKNKGIENIEGELGYLQGKSSLQEAVEIEEEDLTDPNQAEEFIEKTGVTSLAVAIGNIHGIFKSGQNPHLFLDRLKEINNKAGDKVFLVLHGASGIPEEDIKKAVELGIDKINVNTRLRLAYTETLKKFLQDNPEQTTPYKIMPLVVEAVQRVVEEKIKLFNSDNKL